MGRSTKDIVAMVLAATIAAFIMSSLVVLFVLSLKGIALGDVWGALYALVTATLGALGGYLAGRTGLPTTIDTGGGPDDEL